MKTQVPGTLGGHVRSIVCAGESPDVDDGKDDSVGAGKASVTDSFSTIDEKDIFFAPHGQ